MLNLAEQKMLTLCYTASSKRYTADLNGNIQLKQQELKMELQDLIIAYVDGFVVLMSGLQ